jgi:Serine carboxypeptidase
MFYFFFESRDDPANDPVILWMTGAFDESSAGIVQLFETGMRVRGRENVVQHQAVTFSVRAQSMCVEMKFALQLHAWAWATRLACALREAPQGQCASCRWAGLQL